MTGLESFPDLISELQHEAEAALVRGDVGPRLQMWSHNDPVALFAAVGPSKSGWDELEPTFRSVAARLSGGHDVTYEIMSFDVSAAMAWTAGFARFTVSMDGGPLTRYTLRLTHIYRREAGEWKVVHEHSNWEPSDQSSAPQPVGAERPELGTLGSPWQHNRRVRPLWKKHLEHVYEKVGVAGRAAAATFAQARSGG